MYKFLAISLLSFFIASISYASVEGKGLFCADEQGNKSKFIYFKDSSTFESFSINGYEITTRQWAYNLEGTKTIRLDYPGAFYYVNRQTLTLKRDYASSTTCAVANSRQQLISKIQSIIDKAKSKNKL